MKPDVNLMRKKILITRFVLTILISSGSAVTQLKETVREITTDEWSETRKIEYNEYLVYKFQGTLSSIVDVTIDVMSGDAIDTLVLSSENFTDYQSMMKSGRPGDFNYYPTGKGANLKYVNYSFEIPADGIYYIVEDNTYLPNGWGTPGGSAEVKIKFTRKRCIECEEAALEIRNRAEEEARQAAETQRKLMEEMNKTRETTSTPGFGIIFSVLALGMVYIAVRKKI